VIAVTRIDVRTDIAARPYSAPPVSKTASAMTARSPSSLGLQRRMVRAFRRGVALSDIAPVGRPRTPT
jgi:hypothetical protein